MNLIVGNKYKWKHESRVLVYLGKVDGWNQFASEDRDMLWCEVLDSDLKLMEEVK